MLGSSANRGSRELAVAPSVSGGRRRSRGRAMGAAGSELVRQARRVEGLPSWVHARRERGRPSRAREVFDATPTVVAVDRGDPPTLPVTGDLASSADRGRPFAISLPIGRSTSRTGSPPPHAREVAVACRRLPPPHASVGLSTNSRTLAFSCGRRILHAKALCANVREKATPTEISVRTPQGETGVTHGERDVVTGDEAWNRSEREGEAAPI